MGPVIAPWEVAALRLLSVRSLGPEELARGVFGGAEGTIVFDGRRRASVRWSRLVTLGLVERRGARLALTDGGRAALQAWVEPEEADFVRAFHGGGFTVSEAARRCRVSRSKVRSWVEGREDAVPGAGRMLLYPWPVTVAVPAWALPGGGGQRGR